MQNLCTAHTVWDSWQLQCLLEQELTDMGAHWTEGEKCRTWREYLSIAQSPKHHVLEMVVMQALISRSTDWNTNMWQSQLLARAHPALLLTAPKPADRPCEEAREISHLLQGISCPHFTPLHHTAPFTTHTSNAYGLPEPGTTGPQAETDPSKKSHSKPQLTICP